MHLGKLFVPLAIVLAACAPAMVPTARTLGPALRVGLYEGKLEVRVQPGQSTQALPLIWNEALLWVESASLKASQSSPVMAVATNSVSHTFYLPPGDATISAILRYQGEEVGRGASSSVIAPGPNVVLIDMITSLPTLRTLAGQSATGSIDGIGAGASFDGPRGLTADAAGNVYVADYFGHRIRKVTPVGTVTTLAGWGQGDADGTGWTAGASGSAQFLTPTALAFHEGSQKLFVADRGNSRIRLIDLAKSPTDATFVTTFAGSGTFGFYNGPGNIAMFNSPWGLASDGGGTLYVADTNNHMIRKIDAAGNVLTLAGQTATGSIDGTASYDGQQGGTAQFWEPRGVAVDDAGNVYVADYMNHKIRMISGGLGGVVSTVAGGGLSGSESGIMPASLGTATGGPDGTARFSYPNALAWSPLGGASGSLYVSDSGNNRIVRIDLSQPQNGNVVEVALGVTRTPGFADGTSLSGMLYHPWGIAFGPEGKFYVADSENQRVRIGLDRGVGP